MNYKISIDKENLQLILDIQQKSYKDATEILYNALNNKLEEQTKLIYDLKNSLEFTQAEFDSLKLENNELKKDVTDLKLIVDKQEKMIEELKDNQEAQEDYSRRRNIRIDGVIDDIKETSEQTQLKADKIIKEELGLDNIKIETAHRIPKKQNSLNSSPRSIMVRLVSDKQRDIIMRSTKKLKNSRIYINEDFCEATMKIRQNLYPQLKAARIAGNIAFIKRRSLIIKKRNMAMINPQQASSMPSPHTPRRRVSSITVSLTPTTGHGNTSLQSPILPQPLPQPNKLPTDQGNDNVEPRRSQRLK